MVDGLPPDDIRTVDIDRMLPFQNNPQYLHDRTVEMIGWQYISWPGLAPKTARNARKAPMHDHLAEAGACFGTSRGWRSNSAGKAVRSRDLAASVRVKRNAETADGMSTHLFIRTRDLAHEIREA